MADSRSNISYLSAIAKQEAKARRAAELERKRLQKEAERLAKLKAARSKERHVESQTAIANQENQQLEQIRQQLQTILDYTLPINDTIDFDSMRMVESYPDFVPPPLLTVAYIAPQKQQFVEHIKPPTIIEQTLKKDRYGREMREAKAKYIKAVEEYKQKETARRKKLAELQSTFENDKQLYLSFVRQRNSEVDELKRRYRLGDAQAVMAYNTLVLDRSQYPAEFPQEFRLIYLPHGRELVIDYQLPDKSVVPTVAEYKYVKAKDQVEAKPAKVMDVRSFYQDIIAAVTLRTIHEVIEADQGRHIQWAVFNGYIQTVDLATGKDIRPYLVSARVSKEKFLELNLARIDKLACLKNLGANISSRPDEAQAVELVAEPVDKRVINNPQIRTSAGLYLNLMELNPVDFERLISHLCQRLGYQTKLTRASHDGGVDVIAVDTRPMMSGKVIIQAKRYKDVVGASVVRDMYGTMMHEGANKGIIVTTSHYGPDSYEFVKSKPLELINGDGLLGLLEQIGIRARIVIPDKATN